MGTEIGTGTFGKVLRGKCRGKDVAIKVLHKPIDDEKTLNSFKKEVEIMRYVNLASKPEVTLPVSQKFGL